MSALLTGMLGVAINVAPNLFKLFAADREEGDVKEEAVEIVTRLVKTNDEGEANKKIKSDPLLQAKLREELAALEVRALQEQKRTEEEQKQIDLAFLKLGSAEREQQHKQQISLLSTELESVEAARENALQLADSDKWWVAGINPFLSLVITGGFVGALYLIMDEPNIENPEVFYTAIGALATGFATVIGFHFGSSKGSKEKDELIIAAPPEALSKTGDLDSSKRSAGVSDGGTEQDSVSSPLPSPTPSPTPTPRAPLPDPGGRFGLFRQKSPGIIQDLMSDLGLTLNQAAGVVGNIGHECAGFRKLQEVKPIVPGSRGGWGWCQWTGPRRRAFEAWCVANDFDNLSADDANYGFLKHEFETTESNALRHLRKTQSIGDATRSFMEKFERPGVKHLDSRISWAKEALRASRNNAS